MESECGEDRPPHPCHHHPQPRAPPYFWVFLNQVAGLAEKHCRHVPLHVPRGSVHPSYRPPPSSSLSSAQFQGPSPHLVLTPRLPKLTLLAAESRGAGLAGLGIQGLAAVGACFTEVAASLLGDPKTSPIQGLRTPRALTWMGTARGAVRGKHTAAQRHRPPDFSFMLMGSVCAIALSSLAGSPAPLHIPHTWALSWGWGGGVTLKLSQTGGFGVA